MTSVFGLHAALACRVRFLPVLSRQSIHDRQNISQHVRAHLAVPGRDLPNTSFRELTGELPLVLCSSVEGGIAAHGGLRVAPGLIYRCLRIEVVERDRYPQLLGEVTGESLEMMESRIVPRPGPQLP